MFSGQPLNYIYYSPARGSAITASLPLWEYTSCIFALLSNGAFSGFAGIKDIYALPPG